MSADRRRLPIWCRCLLHAIADPQDRELVAGDLVERWGEFAGRRGSRWARRWLRRETLSAAWTLGARQRLAQLGHLARRLDAHGWRLSAWRTDARDAWRHLRSAPGLAAAIVLTLALGIGANTAVYSVLNHALLDPLPYRGGDRLAYVYSGGESFYYVPTQGLADAWRGASSVIEDLTTYGRVRAIWRDPLGTERDVYAARVDPEFFHFLGVRPEAGRTFVPSDPAPPAAAVALVSRAMAARLAGDPASSIGRSFQLVRRAFNPSTNETEETTFSLTVVGVVADGFGFPGHDTDVWFPQGPMSHGTIVTVLARLRPGVRADAANAALLAAERAAGVRTTGPEPIVRFPADILGVSAATALWALQIAVGLVLLIGCVNVSHLLLARAQRLESEAAVRQAIGASRIRLLRSSAFESAGLAVGAAVFGLLIGAGALEAFRALRPDRFLAPLASTRIDAASYAAALGLSVAAVALATLLPAWRASSTDPARALRAASRGPASAGSRTALGMRLLIVTEITLTFVVVVSAALLGRSLTSVMRRDAGFATSNVTHVDFRFEGAHYADLAERRLGLSAIVERVGSLPGVAAVSYGQGLAPASGIGRDRLIAVESGIALPDGDAALSYVGPDYFTTAGIRLAAGRGVASEDVLTGAKVLVLNRSTARQLFPDGPAVGQAVELVTVTGRRSRWTVVGLAEDVRARGLTSEPDGPQIYFPFAFEQQIPTLTLTARTESGAADPTGSLTDAIRSVAGDHAVSTVEKLDRLVADSLARPRFVATLFGSLSVLAIVLASAGVYGIVSYDIARRRRDVGIRLALGAGRARVLAWLLGTGIKPIGVGLLTGLTAALLSTRYLQPLLDAGSPADPMMFAVTLALIAVISGAAVALPARRSSRLDPLAVIRAD